MVNRAFRQALGVVIGLIILVGLVITIPELWRDHYGGTTTGLHFESTSQACLATTPNPHMRCCATPQSGP